MKREKHNSKIQDRVMAADKVLVLYWYGDYTD